MTTIFGVLSLYQRRPELKYVRRLPEFSLYMHSFGSRKTKNSTEPWILTRQQQQQQQRSHMSRNNDSP